MEGKEYTFEELVEKVKPAAESIRRQLEKSVDTLWTDEGVDLEDALDAVADAYLKDAYRECMEKGGNVKLCYKDVAKRTGIAQKYRELWNKPKLKK
ncbi:MAG: hypothetical protein QME47_07550 [Candidatus Thermoplasmatota archaeon]|nr:hypothetical protein [Candidatus Thermoplasmatota archaeon]